MISEHPHKTMVVFVSGLGISESCWDKMINLLKMDNEIKNDFDFETIQTLPRTEGLEQFLNEPNIKNQKNIVLVGHSLGGITILDYIVTKLKRGCGADLKKIRQAILFALPSQEISSFKQFHKRLDAPEKQEIKNVNWPSINDWIVKTITLTTEKVINAESLNSEYLKEKYPLPICGFYANKDVVVPKSSAPDFLQSEISTGLIFEFKNESHLSIIKPNNDEDLKYTKFKEVLKNPRGHKKVFEIEHLKQILEVSPFPDGEKKVEHGNIKRIVKTDNFARSFREVKFSKQNCFNQDEKKDNIKFFTIRYSTKREGFVKASYKGSENKTPIKTQNSYKENGNEFQFNFVPISGRAYNLDLEIYDGFGKGNRNTHFHLNPHADRANFYRKIEFTLDLSNYFSQNFKLMKGTPKLYLLPEDNGSCDDLSHKRRDDCLQKPIEFDEKGVWKWALHDIRTGLLDISWDFED